MAKLQYSTISKRTVEALSVEKDTVFWDRELTGFGVRVYPTGGRVYVAQSRGPDGATRVTVGRHGVISADQARRRAALIIARIKAGEEPVPAPMTPRNGPTVAELAARYLEEHVAVRCKPATAVQCRQVVDKYILPELGKMPLAAVERGHVIDLHHKLSGVPAMANLVIATLSRMFNQAEAWELVPDGVNPCRFVHKYQERKRERFLTEEEFRRLGRVLSEAGNGTGVSARAAAAIRLLMLTGCRRNEILNPCAGRMSISMRASCISAIARRARGRFRYRRRRRSFSRSCPASPALPGCFPARNRGRICAISMARGKSFGRGPGSRMYGSTICGIRLLPGLWRSARACR